MENNRPIWGMEMGVAKDIARLAVADLLDGRRFYVPSYQRGYRWTSKQVVELLQDLLTFAIREKGRNSYYCLQPVVVRRCDNRDLGDWEVIDGQQRLTTLKILLHYLRQKIGEEDWGLLGVDVYSINYETRKKSNDFIARLGTERDVPSDKEPIDFFYMRKAYKTMHKWFYGHDEYNRKGAPDLCDRLREARDAARGLLKDLLVRKPGGAYTTAQVLWYEAGEGENSIRLFNRLNTGKLELTDAELIKGLFLLRDNFAGDDGHREQMQFQKAVNWERMENALHNDAFWSFLTERRKESPNRIDLLLELVFRDWYAHSVHDDNSSIDAELNKKYGMFNHYNDLFNIDAETKGEVIEREWEKIDRTFSVLEDWYSDPRVYNLIGYLCQMKIRSLHEIFFRFQELKSDTSNTRENFIDYLEDEIKTSLQDVVTEYQGCEDESSRQYVIDLAYGDPRVFKILLLLNITHLNRRAADPKLKSGELDICKFPFAVLSGMWDVEHVDSRTSNPLSEPEVVQEWIDTALNDLSGVLTAEQRLSIDQLLHSDDPDRNQKVIRYLQNDVAHESSASSNDKDNIKNLVLLDCATNRSYKNSLFVTKRKKIIARREGGQYVPETTSYVFFKLFEKSANSRWQWGEGDMQCYANYIVRELWGILPPPKEVR